MLYRTNKIRLFFFLFLFTSSFLYAQTNKTDEQGRKQGQWIKYKDGVKSYQGQFLDDYPIGVFYRYYPSGRIMSKSIFSQKGNKNRAEFYYDNRKHSLKAKGNYLEKKKDSIWLLYNETAVLVSQEQYDMGTAQGLWELFDYRGILVKETIYDLGKIHTAQKEFFENGQLQRLITFQHDTINGLFEVYFEDGQIRISGMFLNGLKDKRWTYYHADGSVYFIEEYSEGIILKRMDEKGNHFEMPVENDSIPLDIDPAEMKME
ncbi:MAG: hypothetical protein B7C24_01760 [Bacteroidetes bacterium 4572_77]|nr:MAG: hypothetical protein B7C24_01760 [Bacteroidetes bacterium 4572_77]